MDKCPYCFAETRPGDNFCLNCGNRLVAATPVPASPVPAGIGEATVAAPEWAPGAENWSSMPPAAPVIPAPAASWDDATVKSSAPDQAGYAIDPAAQTMLPGAERIEHPATLILRGDKGELIRDFVLDKHEMTIGRAPTSDILLAKDKLTSRRHATLHYEQGSYYVRDEGSANNTFVNGQQIETMTLYQLKDNDLIGIGEYELVFHPDNAPVPVLTPASQDIADMPTINVSFKSVEQTARTRDDQEATLVTSDPYGTRPADSKDIVEAFKAASPASSLPLPPTELPQERPVVAPAPVPSIPGATLLPSPTPLDTPAVVAAPASLAAASDVKADGVTARAVTPTPRQPATPAVAPVRGMTTSTPAASSENVTFSRITNLEMPVLPDMSALMAALSSLDGQVMVLQEQINGTQEAMRSHEQQVEQTTGQLRTAVWRVTERMDSTIADVARAREALAWADLLQLMEDVMNNPRDIEYVGKLARKARELNKVFQIHQNVLNTMAECNSLLRSLIGEEH